MNELLNWLKRPYPLVESNRAKLFIVLTFGLFTFLFLLLYQPYGADRILENQVPFLLGFGASVSLGLVLGYFIVPWSLPRVFKASGWQVKKEILFLGFCFIVISGLNYTYNRTVGSEIAPQHSFWTFLGITFSIGIFPVLGQVFLTELYLNRRNQAEAARLSAQVGATPISPQPQQLEIRPETVRSAPLVLAVQDFIFATSDNNYSTVYFQNGEVTERKLLRLSLKKLEEQVKEVPELVRCHRSFLINKSRIRDFKGNARALFLELEGYEEPIPVSRSISRQDLL